jgi:hypothetical protein
MADDRSESDPDHFEKLSSKFLEWFQSNPGTRLSAKTTLADLRSRNAGRGVGMLGVRSLIQSCPLTPTASGKYRHFC